MAIVGVTDVDKLKEGKNAAIIRAVRSLQRIIHVNFARTIHWVMDGEFSQQWHHRLSAHWKAYRKSVAAAGR